MEQILKNRVGAQQPVVPQGGNDIASAVPDANAVAQNGEQAAFDGFCEKLSAFFGGNFNIYDKLSQDLLLRHLQMNREQNERIATVLDRDPRLAQMLADRSE